MNQIQKAILRSYKHWARRLPSFYYPYHIRGSRIYLDISESRMMLARLLRCYEIEKHRAIAYFLRPTDVFIDVGVNKGDFALFASRIVGDQGQVLAFEPEPTNAHWIQKSILKSGYNNIAFYDIALSDDNGVADLYIGRKSGWHTLVPGLRLRDKGTLPVQTRSLDSFLQEAGLIDAVNMIKIDVEGAEMRVLRGASQTLARNHDLILLIDIHPQLGVSPEGVCEFLEELGFVIYAEAYPYSTPVTDRATVQTIVAKRPAKSA